MKKSLLIAACILLSLILLIPIPMKQKDGGTIEYRAVLYTVYDMHRINPDPNAENPYIEGVIIEILGVEVFNNTK